MIETGRRAPAVGSHPLRVTHVITGLGSGGAEAALYRLISATCSEARHSVVSLTDGGYFGPRLLADGVPVTYLSMHSAAPNPMALLRLTRLLRAERPDIAHGWMYHANLAAGLAAAAVGGIPVVWGIRHADLLDRSTKRSTRWTSALCASLSGSLPDRIVCCAESALRAHAAAGYCTSRLMVIPNGFSDNTPAPDPVARASIRAELAIPERALVVGLVSRFHPDKDPDNFLRAACLVARANEQSLFLIVGSGFEWRNPTLSARIRELGLLGRVRLLGRRSDVPRILSAIDVFALSSRSEAFPNALAEAMLCGVPSVATDCGDARQIVGASGRIVPTENSSALAHAILGLLAMDDRQRAQLGLEARQWIRATYDMRDVGRRYMNLYAELWEAARREASAKPRCSMVGGRQCG